MRERQQSQGDAAQAARAAEQAARAGADAAVRASADAARQAQATALSPSPVDLSGMSAPQLRRMLEELRSQRADIAGRRSSIAQAYEQASGVNREAIGGRLQIIDNNIITFEAEIARVGRELALKAARSGTVAEPPRGGIPAGYIDEDDAAGMAFGFSFMTAVLVFFFTRRFFRSRYGRMSAPQQQNMLQSNERLDRIEQAVDTIAVEIERVSENQRFMTRLMTETQLGDTIKDVRKSAELAKSAAETG